MHVRVCLLGAFVPLQLVACVPDVIYALGGTFNWHFHKGLQFVITDVRGPLSSFMKACSLLSQTCGDLCLVCLCGGLDAISSFTWRAGCSSVDRS